MLPASLALPLREHLVRVRELHRADLADGFGAVYMPNALDRKYPNAGREWCWQYVFPSPRRSVDPRSGAVRRHRADEQAVQRALQNAVRKAGITKPATPHTLRHYVPFQTMSGDVGGSAILIVTTDRSVVEALSQSPDIVFPTLQTVEEAQ